MSIINKILNWFRKLFGPTNTTAVDAPYKVEAPTTERGVSENTHTFPFPTGVGSVPIEGAGSVETLVTNTPLTPQAAWPFPTDAGFIAVEGMGVIRVTKPKSKPAAITTKSTTPVKTKAVKAPTKPKAVAKPKAPVKTKAVVKPKVPTKPKAPSKKS
jgi:hypothetical protein